MVKSLHFDLNPTSQLISPKLRSFCNLENNLLNLQEVLVVLMRTFGFVLCYCVWYNAVWPKTNWTWTAGAIHRQSSLWVGQTGVGSQVHSRTAPATSVWPHVPCWTHPCNGQESQKSCDRRNICMGYGQDIIDYTSQSNLLIRVWTYLSSSVHHRMSSLPFIITGKCWSLPCLMELDRVVMVRTLPNYRLYIIGLDLTSK